MPATRHQGGVVRNILLLYESEASLLNKLFVHSGRHEEKYANRATQGQLIVRHWTSDDHGISKKSSAAGSQDAVPFLEHVLPVGKVVHRIDTKKSVKRVVGKRQFRRGIHNFESDSLTPLRIFGHLTSFGHSMFVCIDPGDATASCLGQVK